MSQIHMLHKKNYLLLRLISFFSVLVLVYKIQAHEGVTVLSSPHVTAYSYKNTTPIWTYYWVFKTERGCSCSFGWHLIIDLVSAPPSDSTYHFYWLEPPASAAHVAYLVKIWNYPANFTHFAEVPWATDEVKIKHKVPALWVLNKCGYFLLQFMPFIDCLRQNF